jgi:hypothetical protein
MPTEKQKRAYKRLLESPAFQLLVCRSLAPIPPDRLRCCELRGAMPTSVHYLQAKAMDPCDCVANERLGGKLKRSHCCGKRDEYVLRKSEYSCGCVWMSHMLTCPAETARVGRIASWPGQWSCRRHVPRHAPAVAPTARQFV